MIKTFFKLLLCILVYTVVNIIVNAIMPFSQGLKDLFSSADSPFLILFTLINTAWICFTIFFIIRHTYFSGIKLVFNLVYVIFFIQSFLMQIESLLFGFAFSALTKIDIVLLVLTDLFSLLATVPLMVMFFQNKDITPDVKKMDIKDILIRLGIIGIIYVCIYMIFGYFVAWQFDGVRIFYTGSQEKLSFWKQVSNNHPIFIALQILRGILFGFFVIPLKRMISKKISFVISVCLLYLGTAITLIMPNPLFPDEVRIAHLIEMLTSMLLFGLIVANILWGRKSMEHLAEKSEKV